MGNHFNFQILLLCLHLGLSKETTCGRAKYLIGKECCSMCAPGNRVYKHCTEFTSTSCIPCTGSTFLDQHNERTSCFLCTNCDPVSGLKVKQSCTSTSDAVCEPQEGYFCKLPSDQGCKVAQEHSRCKLGQYISQQGTSSTDTKCSDCPADTFSNGSVTACQPFTKCESLGKVQLSPGDTSSDSICGSTNSLEPGVIVGVIVVVIVGVISTVICIILYHIKYKTKRRLNTAMKKNLLYGLHKKFKELLPIQELDSPQ